MGCSLFSNSQVQMGVTVMGFAEHFGLYSVNPLQVISSLLLASKAYFKEQGTQFEIPDNAPEK